MRHQKIKLLDITKKTLILGSAEGDLALNSLRCTVLMASKVVEISMEGIQGVDACFVRNSIASFSKIFCKTVGIIVSNIENIDVLDNLVYGMKAKSVYLLIKNKDGSISFYSDLTSSLEPIVSFVYTKSEVTTSQVAKQFGLSTPNVSAKLKKLHTAGLLHAVRQDAATGGMEYIFSPLMKCSNISFHS